jgi:hypothetical protein
VIGYEDGWNFRKVFLKVVSKSYAKQEENDGRPEVIRNEFNATICRKKDA